MRQASFHKSLTDLYKLTPRLQALDTLLEHMVAVQETLWSSEGYDAGEETGIQTTIFASSPSYRALDRLVKELKADAPGMFWHVGEWYFRAARFPVYQPPHTVRYRSRGTLHEDERRPQPQHHDLRLAFDRRVLVDKVKAGVDWIGNRWDTHRGEIVGSRWTQEGERVLMCWPAEPFVPDELTAVFLPGDDVLRGVAA